MIVLALLEPRLVSTVPLYLEVVVRNKTVEIVNRVPEVELKQTG